MKKTTVLACTLAALLCAGVASAQTITLEQTTKLIPIGWSVGEDIKFQKGTTAELNDEGLVVSGVLNSDTYLRPTGWQSVINDYYYAIGAPAFYPPPFLQPFDDFGPGPGSNVFVPTYQHVRYKGNTPVTFANDGTVLSGTLDEDVTISPQKGKYGFINLKGGTLLSFYVSGTIQAGTLSDDAYLRPVGWQSNCVDESAGFVEFKSGAPMTFSPTGYVTSGTIKNDTLWINADGSSVTLPAKANITFTAQGAAVNE